MNVISRFSLPLLVNNSQW